MDRKDVGILAMDIYFPPTCVKQVLLLLLTGESELLLPPFLFLLRWNADLMLFWMLLLFILIFFSFRQYII
jgi:hypothetical protein